MYVVCVVYILRYELIKHNLCKKKNLIFVRGMNNSVEQNIELDGELNNINKKTTDNKTNEINISEMNQQKSPLNFE